MKRLVRAYLDHLAREGYARGTIACRRKTLALFAASGWSVDRFTATLPQGRPIRRARLSDLRQFLRYAGRPSSIALPSSPRPASLRAPTPEDVRSLLASLDGATPVSLRDRAMAEVLYSTGLRACEVSRLSLADVDLQGRTLHVRGKGGRERRVPFGRAAADWLARYLADGRPRLKPVDEALFVSQYGGRITPDVLRCVFHRMREGVPSSVALTPHALRRAAAVHCLLRGMNFRAIQELLGHADLQTTVRYTRLEQRDLRRMVARFHPREQMRVPSRLQPPTVP